MASTLFQPAEDIEPPILWGEEGLHRQRLGSQTLLIQHQQSLGLAASHGRSPEPMQSGDMLLWIQAMSER